MPVPPVTSEAFANGLEKIARFRDQPMVVKLGGSAMEDPVATDSCLRSVAVLNRFCVPVVLVHGGGKPIDRAMAEAGLVPRKVVGRRYTDEATLKIVFKVLWEINTRLLIRLSELDGVPHAVGGPHFPLLGERLVLTTFDLETVDLGHVGKVVQVNTKILEDYKLGSYATPVIPSLALDADGHWLNINADTAASAVAGALHAEKAIFLTDTPGVLRDRTDPKSLLPKLTEAECRALIASGAIAGGMVPKVEACFEALAAGAKSALILDGREPFSLLDVFLLDSFPGTEITK